MPIYEYKCEQCGHTFEHIQPFESYKVIECIKCKGRAIRKVVNSFDVHYKGDGFYVTDSKNKGEIKKK